MWPGFRLYCLIFSVQTFLVKSSAVCWSAAVKRTLHRLVPTDGLPCVPVTAAANMDPGAQVADEVCHIFHDMKVHKCCIPEEIRKRKKTVIFCLSADKKCIIVEEGKEILAGDTGVTITGPFKHFVGMLPEKDCCYALYDASFETKKFKRVLFVFVGTRTTTSEK